MEYTVLRDKIRAYCESGNVFGVLRVTLKDEILFEDTYGYADMEKKTPFERDTKFTLYSLSKPFCTIGLMKLYDKGLISLDDHPGKYLPEAQGFDSRLTIRHMLHHRSGIPYFTEFPDILEKHSAETTAAMRLALLDLARKPYRFAPDTDSQYSNMNFFIPALIIENITGVPYAEYMREEVFMPLGMKNAYVDFTSPFIEGGAVGHSLVDGRITPVPRVTDWYFGGGDVVGTVDDVYALNRAVKHKLLLKEETWNTILTLNKKSGFGMGCIIIENWNGKFRIQHNGGSRGFRTLHMHLPEDDLDIILLSNSDITDARYPVAEMVYEGLYSTANNSTSAPEMDKGYI